MHSKSGFQLQPVNTVVSIAHCHDGRFVKEKYASNEDLLTCSTSFRSTSAQVQQKETNRSESKSIRSMWQTLCFQPKEVIARSWFYYINFAIMPQAYKTVARLGSNHRKTKLKTNAQMRWAGRIIIALHTYKKKRQK